MSVLLKHKFLHKTTSLIHRIINGERYLFMISMNHAAKSYIYIYYIFAEFFDRKHRSEKGTDRKVILTDKGITRHFNRFYLIIKAKVDPSRSHMTVFISVRDSSSPRFPVYQITHSTITLQSCSVQWSISL